MTRFDLSPLYRSSVGFDRLVSLVDQLGRVDDQGGFPPYNIERRGDNEYRITMAVAGFSQDDLDVEVKENVLTVSGGKSDDVSDDNSEYLHQGIAARSFVRRFQLADHVEVRAASVENGLLHIDLVREIPEAMKARNVEITANGDSVQAQITDQS